MKKIQFLQENHNYRPDWGDLVQFCGKGYLPVMTVDYDASIVLIPKFSYIILANKRYNIWEIYTDYENQIIIVIVNIKTGSTQI